MAGILIEDSTGLEFTAVDNFEVPSGGLEPPAGGQQVSHVVITGNSSGVIFRNLEDITGGAGALERSLFFSRRDTSLRTAQMCAHQYACVRTTQSAGR